MKPFRSPLQAIHIATVGLAIAACTSETTAPVRSGLTVANAKSAATATANPNAFYVFDDSVNVAAAGATASWSAAGIRGDARLRNGAASTGSPSNEYQGDYCGVYGVIDSSKQAKSTFNTDPDINWTTLLQAACGSPRLYSFFLNGFTAAPTMAGPHSVVDTLGVIAVGQSSNRLVKFGVQLSNCDGIRFGNDYPPANDAKVTRLTDVSTSGGFARRWLVESQGSHIGACVMRTKSGALVANGVTYYLPFAFTITEVLQPAPKFP